MKAGIIFDLDGTLLDTLEDLADAVNYALQVHGFPKRSRQEIRSFVGNGAKRLVFSAVPQATQEDTALQVLQTFYTYYGAHAQEKTQPYPGVLPCLKTLSARYPLAVVSNKPDSAVKKLCGQYFGKLYAAGETDACPRKPSPDMLLRAMQAIGVDTCVYVGDSEVDIQTAKNARVPCLSVLWGFRDEEALRRSGAEHFCPSPEKLAEHLITMIESEDRVWQMNFTP